MFGSIKLAVGAVALCSIVASAQGAVLVNADFSGTAAAAVGSIAPSNAQITTETGVTYDGGAVAVQSIPTTGATWVYDGTGTAAANANVFDGAAANFASTTRFDVFAGLAAAGSTYQITGAQIVVRALNDNGINWSMGYRTTGAASGTVIGGELLTTQTGTDALTTYTIDLTAAGLGATEFASTFDRTSSGRIRFLFNDTTGIPDSTNDNFQVDAIRLIGTVTVPEPASMLAGFGLAAALLGRRRKSSN